MSTVDERLTRLEDQVEQLLKKPSISERPWWEERFGAFADDPLYDAAVKAGAEYRKSQIPDYMKDDPIADVRA